MDPHSITHIGRYEVVNYIDEGAFAWVFEVRDQDPVFAGRRLALKMLKPEAARGDEFQRFMNEAAWLARIEHPNVVAIYDFGQDEATQNHYYAMSFVDGPTLKMRLKDSGPMTSEEAVPLFEGLLDGLEALHSHNIVHRDIKPANVLIDSRGVARLGDLGIAREQTESSQTRTGIAVGTALYMSPEQARGKPVDARSDLFSLALTLYESLTGNIIYDHVDSIDSTSGLEVLMYIGSLVMNHTEFQIVFPDEANVPRPLQEVLRRSLRISPDDRYPDVAAMRAALREATAPEPVAAHAAPGRPAWQYAAAAGLALALFVGGYSIYGSVESGGLRRDAEASLEATQTLRERALAIVEKGRAAAASGGATPSADADWLAAAELLVSKATDDLVRGEQTLVAGIDEGDDQKLGFAQQRFRDARSSLHQACASAAENALAPQSAATIGEVTAVANRLDAAGAAAVASEAWAALGRSLDAVSAAPDAVGCELSDAEIERSERAAQTLATALALETDLPYAWENAAVDAFAAAQVADEKAMVRGLRAPSYLQAYRSAKRTLLRGEVTQRGGGHRRAHEMFVEARNGFETAANMSGPAATRDRAESLLDAVKASGGDVGRAPFLISEGDQAMEAEDWDRAGKLFEEAAAALEGTASGSPARDD